MTTHDKMLAAIDAYFSASDAVEEEAAENLLLDVRDEINKHKLAEQPAQQEPVACERCLELERLCDATYVAQGADAYNHACNEMERWQHQRHTVGKVVGTTGSLCDGIAWLYGHIDELEEKIAAPQPPAQPLTDEPEIVQRVKRYAGQTLRTARNPNITARECIELADWIAAHGITKGST